MPKVFVEQPRLHRVGKILCTSCSLLWQYFDEPSHFIEKIMVTVSAKYKRSIGWGLIWVEMLVNTVRCKTIRNISNNIAQISSFSPLRYLLRGALNKQGIAHAQIPVQVMKKKEGKENKFWYNFKLSFCNLTF